MSIILQNDRRHYLGSDFVYFDGVTVSECTVMEVSDVWTWIPDRRMKTMELVFNVKLKDRPVVLKGVTMDDLYMNWNSWMRTMLLKGHTETSIKAELNYAIVMSQAVETVKFAAETVLEECNACIKEVYDRTFMNKLSEAVEDALDDLKQFKGKWEAALRYGMPVREDTDWRVVLLRLLRHQINKEKSMKARKEWRQDHAIQR